MIRRFATLSLLAFLATTVFAQNAPSDKKDADDTGWTSTASFEGSANSGTFSVVTAPGFPPIVVHFVVVRHGTEIHGVTNGSAITYSAYKVNEEEE